MGIFLFICFIQPALAKEVDNLAPSVIYKDELNQAQFNLAIQLANEGKYREANELLLNLYQRTQSSRVLLEGARILYLAEEFDESEKLFKEVLKLNPPMMVRERVAVYLDGIAATKGKLDATFGLVRDTNPKSITNSRTLTIFGQTFDYNPHVDTSPQWGASYLLSGFKNFGDYRDWGVGFSVSGTKFANKDFDRASVEEFLTYRLMSGPKVVAKVSGEHYFYGDKVLYNMPSLSAKHTYDGASGLYWTNEIKHGWITYPDYEYLNGIVKSYVATIGAPVLENVILGIEGSVDRTTAIEQAYAFKSLTGGLVANLYVPSAYVKTQIKFVHTNRKYDAPDPFFGDVRKDQKNGVYLNLLKTDWVFEGVMPSLDLGYEKSKSNIDLYSYKRLTSTINFRKAF